MKDRLFRGAAGALMAVAVMMPVTVMAAEFRSDESGTTTVSEAVDNDLYAAGGNVTLSGSVTGDGVFAGGNVLVSGAVGGGLIAAGGTITALGKVDGNLRVIGGNIFINNSVGRDAIALGGQISVAPTATIGRDLVILGGAVTIDGPVNGNVYVKGGDVTLNAPIKGSVNITAQTVAFGPRAAIDGKLIYSSPAEAVFSSSMAKGGVEYHKILEKGSADAVGVFAAFFNIALLIKLVSLVVVALILTAIFKKRSKETVQSAFTGFGWNILHGFAAIVLVPIASLILLITIIGAPLAVIAMCAYGILLALSGILAPIMLGGLVWKMFKKSGDYPLNPYTIIVGAALFVLIAAIPVLGWIFSMVFFFAAVGTLARMITSGITAAQNKK